MAENGSESTRSSCSFCDKHRSKVKRLLVKKDGAVAICNECVELAAGALFVSGDTEPGDQAQRLGIDPKVQGRLAKTDFQAPGSNTT